MTQVLLQTRLPLPNRRQGKVRDIYEASAVDGQEGVLIVASDRISAFDVVMPNGVPGKGVVLTQISRFWFDMIARQLGDRVQHHLITTDASQLADISDEDRAQLAGRIVLGRHCRVLPIECVVRGYLAGSGWKEYQQNQQVCGVALPAGLKQCEALPEPIFTPATKAEEGHDENISFAQAVDIVGEEHARFVRDTSIAIYRMAHDYAKVRGIILADTKFEFGIPLDQSAQKPILVDEALTPDSSRFWPMQGYETGHDQPSFDKQYVRNYLQELVDQGKWQKQPPGPELPDKIVQGTLERYLQAYEMLTGQPLNLV